jgi:hypothetical protein
MHEQKINYYYISSQFYQNKPSQAARRAALSCGTFFKSCGTFFKTLPKNQKKSQELNAVFLILDIYFCPFFDFFKKHVDFFEKFVFVTIMKN